MCYSFSLAHTLGSRSTKALLSGWKRWLRLLEHNLFSKWDAFVTRKRSARKKHWAPALNLWKRTSPAGAFKKHAVSIENMLYCPKKWALEEKRLGMTANSSVNSSYYRWLEGCVCCCTERKVDSLLCLEQKWHRQNLIWFPWWLSVLTWSNPLFITVVLDFDVI